jgi:prepilin-type N-terminal cleavage/methylation domain-containing protein
MNSRLAIPSLTARRGPRAAAGPRALVHSRRGFSFTEVLFAVMILGIGFIMVAAIFPVAIQQTQNNSSEGTAASIARGAAAYMQQTLVDTDIPRITPPDAKPGALPGRARVYAFRDPPSTKNADPKFGMWLEKLPKTPTWQYADQLWDRVKGAQIVSSDPRYGWVGLFRRDPSSSYVQIYVIVTQARVSTNYQPGKDLALLKNSFTVPMANLQPKPLQVRIVGNRLSVLRGPGAGAVAEGCFLIIANDNLEKQAGRNPTSIPPEARIGWMNGRIYRVGNNVGGNSWDLMPGSDFSTDPGPDGQLESPTSSPMDDVRNLDDNDVDAFVVGRTLVPGTGGTATYDGPAQDVAIYTTFVQLK